MFSSLRKKNTPPAYADRFIPLRQNFEELDIFRPEPARPIADTPYNQSVFRTLHGMTIEQYNKRRVLFFSTQNIRKTNELTESPPASEQSGVTPTLEKPYKILDAPNLPDDFYGYRIAWSASERIYAGLPDETPTSWAISGAPLFNSREMFQFEHQNTVLHTINTYQDDYIFSGWKDGYMRTYQLSSLRYTPTHEIRTQENTAITIIAIINQTKLFVGYKNGLIGQIDSRTSPSNCTYYDDRAGKTAQITGLAYNHANYLLSGDDDGIVKIWDIRRMSRPVFNMHAHTAATKGLAFNPSNNYEFISGGGSACKRLFLTNITTQKSKALTHTETQITGIHWFPASPQHFVSSHSDGIKLWSLKPHRPLELLSEHKTEYRAHTLISSPTGNEFAVAQANECICFFKPHDMKLINERPLKKQRTSLLSAPMVIR